MDDTTHRPQLKIQDDEANVVVVSVEGDWTTRFSPPDQESLERAIENKTASASVRMDFSALQSWDSALLCFVDRCRELCEHRGIAWETSKMPEGVSRLLKLSRSVPEKKDARAGEKKKPYLATLGQWGLDLVSEGKSLITFVGETAWAFYSLLRGRAQFRWSDTLLIIYQCGPQALGVVALINFLIGLILAFVGAIQLTQFGASVYVADLVAIGTVREMSCVMTGIIMCGRTGAAFAAQLGTMKVTEEIDAFKTFGISPVEFLVLPRMIALVLMMPLLCVFADFISIAGGYLVSISILDITSTEYINRTIAAITLKSFLIGVFKGSFFGFLVALTGCLRGMQCGTNAAAVGEATTKAVVAGITSIVAADGVFAIICNALNL